MFTDSHAHLDFYSENERNIVIQNAKSNGVEYILNAGSSLNSHEEILNIVDKKHNIFGAIGLHPHEVEILMPPDLYNYLINTIKKSDLIVGIGETGLDYSHDNYNKKLQYENFIIHLEIAKILNIPIIIHNRDSNDDLLDILNKYKGVKGVLHSFTGDTNMAKKILDMGFYISASGIVTFKNAKIIADSFSYIPIERILIETDSPYLAPTPYRGKRNEPAFVIEIAKKIAELKCMEYNEIGTITTKNFKNLFGI